MEYELVPVSEQSRPARRGDSLPDVSRSDVIGAGVSQRPDERASA
jgi:hypothetical protein